MVRQGNHKNFVFDEDFRAARNKKRKEAAILRGPLNKPFVCYADEMRLKYGGVHKKKAVSNDCDFDRALGGWRAVILKKPKPSEFKYQLVSSGCGTLTFTNEVKVFIAAVIKACDPDGRFQIDIVER